MKKVITIAILLVAFTLNVSAQGVEKQMGTSASASQVYLELGGPGIIYSLNYDQRFKKEENGFGFRVGIGGATTSGEGYVAVPIQVNYLLGNSGQYLELGGGLTYVSPAVSFDFFSDDNETNILGTATIGFRKVPFGKKGFTWRVAFTPFLGSFGFQPFGGVSLGYRF